MRGGQQGLGRQDALGPVERSGEERDEAGGEEIGGQSSDEDIGAQEPRREADEEGEAHAGR